MDIVTLALAKSYTKQSLIGKGAIKGDKGDQGEQGIQGVQGEKGDDGFSPSASVRQLSDGAEIEIIDKSGTMKATVRNVDNIAAIEALKETTASLGTDTASIPANADLNDYTTPGNYKSGTGANSSTLSNYPSDLSPAAFKLSVNKSNNDFLRQTIEVINLINAGAAIYTRICSGTTWTKWFQLATTSDLPTLTSKRVAAGSWTSRSSNVNTTYSSMTYYVLGRMCVLNVELLMNSISGTETICSDVNATLGIGTGWSRAIASGGVVPDDNVNIQAHTAEITYESNKLTTRFSTTGGWVRVQLVLFK